MGRIAEKDMDESMKEQLQKMTPHKRAAKAGIGGSIVAVLVWALQTTTGILIPAEVAAEITAIVGFAITQWG